MEKTEEVGVAHELSTDNDFTRNVVEARCGCGGWKREVQMYIPDFTSQMIAVNQSFRAHLAAELEKHN